MTELIIVTPDLFTSLFVLSSLFRAIFMKYGSIWRNNDTRNNKNDECAVRVRVPEIKSKNKLKIYGTARQDWSFPGRFNYKANRVKNNGGTKRISRWQKWREAGIKVR